MSNYSQIVTNLEATVKAMKSDFFRLTGRKLTLDSAIFFAGKVQASNSKIKASTYNLPTSACKVGSKLRFVPSSPCFGCYAVDIENGVHGSTVLKSENRNLENLTRTLKLENGVAILAIAYAYQIALKSLAKLKKGDKWGLYHRWFSSGDVQGYEHLRALNLVGYILSPIKFWLPTQEKALIQRMHRDVLNVPASNLVVRLSAPIVNSVERKLAASKTVKSMKAIKYSVVDRNAPTRLTGLYCHVTEDKNSKSCGNCSACWDSEARIVYKDH